jgi:hypothetical protein
LLYHKAEVTERAASPCKKSVYHMLLTVCLDNPLILIKSNVVPFF